MKSDHELAHEFHDWMNEQIKVRPSIAWRGLAYGLETFIKYKPYYKTYFREWAIAEKLPPSKWKSVFREFIND